MKGRNYAEIEEMFQNKVPARKFKTYVCHGAQELTEVVREAEQKGVEVETREAAWAFQPTIAGWFLYLNRRLPSVCESNIKIVCWIETFLQSYRLHERSFSSIGYIQVHHVSEWMYDMISV